jgi:Tol biopolymer transport system component
VLRSLTETLATWSGRGRWSRGSRHSPWPDPTLETYCGHWSPGGQRLACESFGVTDPRRNGIYTIRSSDGGGLRRVTSNPGGDDALGDYSPDGRRLVFVRSDENGPVGLFVVKLDGSGLRQITPPGFVTDGESGGSWSPTGTKIVFTRQNAPDQRSSIWVVKADGSGLHELRITPACGGAFSDPKSISCYTPGWSPDGTKIVFTRVSANGAQRNIFTVNANGSGLSPVTSGANFRREYSDPDWGPHPVIP